MLTKPTKPLLLPVSLLILLGIAIAVTVFSLQSPQKLIIPELNNEKGLQVFEDPIQIPEIALFNHEGLPFNKGNLKNQWSIMFFGYTYCPDVCPTTLTIMDESSSLIEKQTSADNFPVKYIFVSVDPVRDTAKGLKDFIKYFNKDFIAVTGNNNEEVDILSKPMGVVYDFEDMKTNLPIRDISTLSKDKAYLVNHFAGIYIIDPYARVAAVTIPPHDAKQFARILKTMRTFYKDNIN